MKRKKDSEITPDSISSAVDVSEHVNLNTEHQSKIKNRLRRYTGSKKSPAPKILPTIPPNRLKRHHRKPLRPGYAIKTYKRFKEDYPNEEHSEYDADISESSLEGNQHNSENSCNEVIDTSELLDFSKEVLTRGSEERKENIKRLWDKLVLADNKEKDKKKLTSDYITYIGEKLNLLFCKYTIPPWSEVARQSHNEDESQSLTHIKMAEIFSSKTLCDMLVDYYYLLNDSESIKGKQKKIIHELFSLLEEDYKKLYKKEPHFIFKHKGHVNLQ